MSEFDYGLNGVADKRYYHFLVVNGVGDGLSGFWKSLRGLGEVKRSKRTLLPLTSRFLLEHRKLLSNRAYARGSAAQSLSERGNGRPPFLYDVFASRIKVRGGVFSIFGFPFAELAREVVDYLIADGFLRGAEFEAVELSELLKEKNRPLRRFEGLSSRIVGVQFVVTDDKSLTAVKLGGDDPFHAQIYEFFLKRKFEEGLWVPDKCVMSCELESGKLHAGGSKSQGEVIRSRLHLDKAGNFKFYTHVGCANLILLPYAIHQIDAVGCFKHVFGNPLRRTEQEDDN